ncbi:protein NRT1/ PTR FAMILY 1.2-like [Zingiber officinale]|nr:protein NRT1/ PTR FAMILY 1.2-like [Zingiber officinale]
MAHDSNQEQSSSGKGGLRTMPFIIANEVLEKISSSGLQSNMVIYLTREYHMGNAAAAVIMLSWGALSNITPIFGAFLSDSYLGRFRTIAFATISCFVGLTLMWLTAMIPGAKPQPDSPATPHQMFLLFLALAFSSIGSAGVRPCSIPFGADQFTDGNTSDRERTLRVYFNCYYASVGLSFIFASTVVVYVQDRFGWKVGFAVPVALIVASASMFLAGSPMYVKVRSRGSTLTGFGRVVVAAVKNRNVDLEKLDLAFGYEQGSSEVFLMPSDKLRFLNRACIRRYAGEPRVCTVEQVEDLKSVIGVLPLWSAGIMVSLVMSQQFGPLQAEAMNRRLGGRFTIPAGSFSVFQLLTMTLLSACYDSYILPAVSKLSGRPARLTLKQRMGIGVLISTASTAVAALVEAKRRRTEENRMSALWLVPQYALVGLAEAFSVIGQVEFFYVALPRTMSSYAVALWTLGLGVSNLIGTALVKAVQAATARGGRPGWLATDLDEGHYDYYYWVLTAMGVVDFFYFLVCIWAYGEEVRKKPWEVEGEALVEEQSD